jgi:cellulose biosynthesis protein BcsQ
MIPAPLPARTLDQLQAFLQKQQSGRTGPARNRVHRKDGAPPQSLAFFTMVDRRRRLHRELVEELTSSRPEVLSTVIPSASAIEMMGVRRAPVREFQPRGAAAESYVKLWREISERLVSPG